MASEKPNVLMIIADTLRPDFLSTCGGHINTKSVDYLAENGTLFRQAYAPGPYTPISHGGLFSGRYPSQTGIVGEKPVYEDITTLAEWLSSAGYDTFGIPGPGKMGSEFNFDKGFNKYFETFLDDHPGYTDTNLIKKIIDNPTLRRPLLKDFFRTIKYGPDKLTSFKFDLLRSEICHNLKEPFFGMVNVTTVHRPYTPPRPYKRRVTENLNRTRWYLSEYLLGAEETFDTEGVREDRVYHFQNNDGLATYLADPDYLNQAEINVLKDWYGSLIKYLDNILYNFLSWLRGSRYNENTIIILTSDHGEYFGEHDLLAHPWFLFEEGLRVPLVISGPDVPSGQRRSDLVSLIDLFDTICDLSGITPPKDTTGTSLFQAGEKKMVFAEHGVPSAEDSPRMKYLDETQLERFAVGRKCVITNDEIYILRSDNQEQLFKKGEDREIIDPNEKKMKNYREAIEKELGLEFISIHRENDISSDVEENLRQLGYID